MVGGVALAALPYFVSGDPVEKALNKDFLNEIVSRLNRPTGTRTIRETVDPKSTIEILAVNNTSGAYDVFNVMTTSSLGLTLSDETDRLGFQRRPLISLEDFTSTTDFPLIALEPIAANGGIGRVAAGGVALCKVNFSSASHEYANPAVGVVTQLTSSATQGYVRVLWKESGTGVKWALVTWEQPGGSASVAMYSNVYVSGGYTGIGTFYGSTAPSGVTLNGATGAVQLDNNKTMTGTITFDMAMEVMPGRAYDPLYTRCFLGWTDASPRTPIVVNNSPQEGFAHYGPLNNPFDMGAWFGAGISFTGPYPCWVPYFVTFAFVVANTSGSARSFGFYHSAGDTQYDYDWSGVSRNRMGRVSMFYTVT